jgi:hypothetical protein
LALLQEEALDSGRKRSYIRFDSSSSRMPYKSAPSYNSLPKFDRYPEDPRQNEAGKNGSIDEKLKALKKYHHAKGLCD